MKAAGKGKKGDWGFGFKGDKGKGKGKFEGGFEKGKGKEKGFDKFGFGSFDAKGFDKGFGKGKAKGAAEFVVSGCRHETVGSIIRGEYGRHGSNHGRPTYKKMGPGQEVQIYFWDSRDGPGMCGWWFGAAVGGDMVWSFRPGEAPTPPRTGWKVPFEGQVDASLVVNAAANGRPPSAPAPPASGVFGAPKPPAPPATPAKVEVGQETHISVGGCVHPVVGTIVNGNFVRTGENHGKPVYKKTEQTKDGVDVLIYFWNDVQNPSFCGWWFGPQVGAEQVWAFNPGRMTTAPLSGWKVPYDGPVDQAFRISVDRKASAEEKRKRKEVEAKQHAEVNRAAKEIRAVLGKLKVVRVENLEELEGELKTVMEKELGNCDPKAKMQEECDKALEQAKKRVEQLKEAQAKAEPMMKELESLLKVAEVAMEALQKKITKSSLEEAEASTEACSKYIIEGGSVLTMGENVYAKLARLQDCKKALRKARGQKKHQDALSKMATFDANKDGFLDRKDLKKYAQSEFKFALPDACAEKIMTLLVPAGAKGVKKDDFQRVKVQVGIAREQKIDLERKKKREQRELEIEEMKEKMKGSIEEMTSKVGEVEELSKTMKAAQQALKSPEVKSTELIAKLQELASQSAEVVEKSVALRKAMNELKEGAEKEVVRWLQTELKPLFAKCKSAEQAAGQSSQFVKRQRLTADKRQRSELEQLQRQALDVIRQYQKAKDIANDGVFGEMSAAGEEESVVSESSFVAFFEKCRQECGNGEAVKMPAEEDLRRLLTYWDEAGAGHLSEERVGEILRRFMKVVTKTTLTKGVSIKDSEGIRKLEVNEVVELLGQEAQEPEVEVMRVKVRVLNDGTEGWVTLSGNQGTHYLKEGGGTFKVVKETLLMEEFDIASGAKDTDRKLKVGELVEARSWMKKHEESGLTRLRCKALSDGAVGWATVVGNQGTKYLEVK